MQVIGDVFLAVRSFSRKSVAATIASVTLSAFVTSR